MKSIPENAKKIKITFVCDVCGVDTTCETEVLTTDILVNATCPVCYKVFPVKVTPKAVEVPDVDDGDITIEII